MSALALESSGVEWILLAIGGVFTLILAIGFFIMLRKDSGRD